MSISKLPYHYSFTNPASVYDEEALTALELAGRQGAKINEVVDAQNNLQETTDEHLKNQDTVIETRLNAQDEAIPKLVTSAINTAINKGEFDSAINRYANDLEGQIANLVQLEEGSTTGDAELIDTRTDFEGVTSATAGSALRKQGRVIHNRLEDTNEIFFRSVDFETVTVTQPKSGSKSMTAGHYLFYLWEPEYVIDFTPSFGGVSGTIEYSVVRMPDGVGNGLGVEILSSGTISAGASIPVNRIISQNVGIMIHYNADCPPFSALGDSYPDVPLAILYRDSLTVHSIESTGGLPYSFAGNYRSRRPAPDTTASWIVNGLNLYSPKIRQQLTSPATKGEIWGFAPNNAVYIESFTPFFESGADSSVEFSWYVVKSKHGFIKGQPIQIVDTGVCNVGGTITLNRLFDSSTGLFLYCADYMFYYKGVATNNLLHSSLLRIDSDLAKINSSLTGRILCGDFVLRTPSKLAGHSWSVLGDSISDTSAYNPTIKMYFDYIADGQGMTVYNYGVSGEKLTDMLSRYNSMNYSDIITVFAGVNDWGHSNYTPLGEMGDSTADTFYGALEIMCEGLQTKYPASLVIFMTPLGNNGFFSVTEENAGGHTIQDYAEAIRKVCEKHMIPVCDLCKCSRLNPQNLAMNTRYYADGLHLNTKGHEVVAHLLRAEMERHYIDSV